MQMQTSRELPDGGEARGDEEERVEEAEAFGAGVGEQLPQLPHGFGLDGSGFLPHQERPEVAPPGWIAQIDQRPYALLTHGEERLGGFGFHPGQQGHRWNAGKLAHYAGHGRGLLWGTLLDAGDGEKDGGRRPAAQIGEHLVQGIPVDGGEAASGGRVDAFLLPRGEQGVDVVSEGGRRL
jgi:hypothetical protein